MAIYKQDIVNINLESGSIFRSFLNKSIGHKDDDADRFGVRVFRDGEAVDLSGLSCQAVFMAPNGVNIALTSYGTVSGNVAYVTLPPACYDYEGQFCLAIKLVGGGVTSTVRIVDGVVERTGTSGAVAPTSAVPTYQEILAVYAQMQEDIEDYESVVANQDEKINELRNAINQYQAEYVICESGAYNDPDGNIKTVNSARIRNAVPVCVDNLFAITIPNGYQAWIWRHDKSFTPISPVGEWKSGKILVSDIATSATKYITFSIKNTSTPSSDISSEVSTVQNGILLETVEDYRYNKTVTALSHNYADGSRRLDPSLFEYGFTSNGNVTKYSSGVAVTNWIVTTEIQVAEYDIIFTPLTGFKHAVALYDSSNNWISGTGNASTTDAISVSKGQHYRITITKDPPQSELADYWEYSQGIKVSTFLTNIGERVSENERIEKKHDDGIDAIANNIFQLKTKNPESTSENWRLNESDGLCSSNNSYKLMKYPVNAGQVVVVASDDRFQFQTSSSVPSSGTSNRVGETYKEGTFILEVPNTATYLIVSTVKTGSTASVKIGTIEHDLSITRIQGYELRNGSALHLGNLNGVTTPVVFTKASKIKVFTNRPNRTGYHYLYGYYSAMAEVDDLYGTGQASGSLETIYDTYEPVDGCFGVQLSIYEQNDSTSEISQLRISDFAGYYINVYDISKSVGNSIDLPPYYTSYMQSRIATVRERDIGVGENGCAFVFITDLHEENKYYSALMAKQIIENTAVDSLVYGGDYINQPSSKSSAVNLLYNVVSKCRVVDDAVFLRGNHETNPYGTGQLTASEVYRILNGHIEKYINTNKKNYYYLDNESQKIRYIFLDTGEDGDIDATQLTWVGNAADLDSSHTLVIISHMAIHIYGKDNRSEADIEKYNVVDKVLGAISGTSAKVACWICGHDHKDFALTTGDFPIISVTCDANGSRASISTSDDRTAGTTNEQAFDVFHIDTSEKKVYATRFGGGQYNVLSTGDLTDNDREWTYT